MIFTAKASKGPRSYVTNLTFANAKFNSAVLYTVERRLCKLQKSTEVIFLKLKIKKPDRKTKCS